jgi:C-terminal processing protease CtpA/Prc
MKGPAEAARHAALLVTVFAAVVSAGQPRFDRVERQRVQQMLSSLKNEISKNYYDFAFHGLDLEQHFSAANARLEQATSLGHALGIVAQALLDFDDSHTFFLPPSQTTRVDFEWKMQIVGDDCYLVAIKPGSDGERKGLKPGARVLAVEGRKVTRQTLWKIEYQFYVLSPRPGLRLSVQLPGESPKDVDVLAKVSRSTRVLDLSGDTTIGFDDLVREAERNARPYRHRYVRLGSIAIWKMQGFDYEPEDADRVASEALKGADSLILDMRGNPGGAVKTLERLAGRFFGREVKIADLKGRKSLKPIVAKKHNRPFAGRIVALVDSRSGSAAELLARLLQLEKRGVVLGDRSAGAVMQAYVYSGQMGGDNRVYFGASITNADVIMTDGKSLEKTGLTPDELIRPTTDDIAGGLDPVLARASEILGARIDPKAAGAMFPIEWR